MIASNERELFVLGTAKLNIINEIDRPAVNNALESLKEAEQASWILCKPLKSPAEKN